MLAGRVRNCENADSAVLRWPELGVVAGRRGRREASTSSREGFKSVCVLGAWRRQVGRFQLRQRERSLELVGTRGSRKEEM